MKSPNQKRKFKFLGSFQTQLTITLILSLLFIGALSNYLVYRGALKAQFEALRNQLKITAQTAALLIDGDIIAQVPLNPEGVKSREFQIVAEQLNKIREVNSPIEYIYTLTQTDQKGILKYVVDPDYEDELPTDEYNVWPGTIYEAYRFPEMMRAFHEASADTKIEVDEWGGYLSGYAPIYDHQGNVPAILGVDIASDDVYEAQRGVHKRAIVVLFLGLLLSFGLGLIISRNLTKPIKGLVNATHFIEKGALYKVNVEGPDEIQELSSAFNRMSENLHESKSKLINYFYRVVQSMIRILEAKDHCTRGHSERVSEYSEKIALRMGFSEVKAELIKEIAMVHDIGKLAIHDNILNKEGKLTDEEWKQIRQHPIVGEDILKPVLMTEEMLAIVRGHHERYDGTGYPDQLSGENLNTYAAIVSVADAYDAMISKRVYRRAKSKKEAIEELIRNKGSQFHPEIVDVFVKILKENA